jgi:hypothetical protein
MRQHLGLFILIATLALATPAGKKFGKEAVWHPRAVDEQRTWTDMQQCGAMMAGGSPGSFETCTGEAMRKHGAPEAAIAFNKATGGNAYAIRFLAFGKVDVMEGINAFQADTSDQLFFINGDPDVVSADEVARKLDPKSNGDFRMLLKKYPDAYLLPHAEVDSLRPMVATDGGDAFAADVMVMNGCQACARIGRAIVEYDFDQAGKFKGGRIRQVVGES